MKLLRNCESSDMASAVVQFIDEITQKGALRGVDIANIANVSKATVSRWSNGQGSPQPRTQLIISDLHYVVGRLKEFYSPSEVRDWLYARHPQLSGQKPIDVINAGKTEEVITVLDRLDGAVFL